MIFFGMGMATGRFLGETNIAKRMGNGWRLVIQVNIKTINNMNEVFV